MKKTNVIKCLEEIEKAKKEHSRHCEYTVNNNSNIKNRTNIFEAIDASKRMEQAINEFLRLIKLS